MDGAKVKSDTFCRIHWCAVAVILETLSYLKVHRVTWFSQVNVSPIKIHYQLIQVYFDSILRVQHVKKWCR